MDWSTPVDLYCERLGPSFWAEPVNAFSNAAFLISQQTDLATPRIGVRESTTLPAS